MIEIKDISISYDNNKKIIDGMNMTINNGEIFGFIGPNGAGKTTTIASITGILDIDKGDILLDEKSIKNNPIEAKKQFGLVPDSPETFDKLTGLEYLNFIADIYEVSKEERFTKVSELAEKFGIKNNLKDRIQSYSHGMKQKLLIISVLLHNPKNWILDEPMTGLDPEASFNLKELMKKHKENGNTVFFSTHVLEVAEKLCDRIAIINSGKIVYIGTCEDFKKSVKNNGSLEEKLLEGDNPKGGNQGVNGLTKILWKNNKTLHENKRDKIFGIISFLIVFIFLSSVMAISSFVITNKLMEYGKGNQFIIGLINLNFLILFAKGVVDGLNSLYYSKDLKIFLTMPIKSRELVKSKILNMIYSEYQMQFILLGIPMIMYGILSKVSFEFYLYCSFIFTIIPIIPIVITALIDGILMRVLRFIKNKTKLMYIVIMISFIFSGSIANLLNAGLIAEILSNYNNMIGFKLLSIYALLTILLYLISLGILEKIHLKGVVGVTISSTKKKTKSDISINDFKVKNKKYHIYQKKLN